MALAAKQVPLCREPAPAAAAEMKDEVLAALRKFISVDGRNFWIFVAGDFTNNTHVDKQGRFDSYYGLWMIPVRVT